MQDLFQKIKVWYEKMMTRTPSYERPAVRPSHDWVYIFVTTQIAILLVASIAIYFYIEVDKGKLFVVVKDEVQNEAKINTVLLEKTVDDINKREANLIKSQQEKISPPDPSR